MLKKISESSIVNIFTYLVLGVIPIIIVPTMTDRFYTPKLFVTYGICLVMAVYLLRRKSKITLTNVDKLFALFLGILLISCLFSIDKYNSFVGIYSDREPVSLFLCYFIIFIVVSKLWKVNEKIFDYILIISSLISIYATLQYFGIDFIKPDYIRQDWGIHPFSTLGYRNAVGAYTTLMLPIAFTFYLFKGNIKYLIHSAITFSALLSCTTRSGFVGVGVFLVIIIAINLKDKAIIKKYIIGAIVLATVFCTINFMKGGAISSRVGTIGKDFAILLGDDYTAKGSVGTGRVHIWRNGISALKNKPILGYGVDNFRQAVLEDKAGEENLQYLDLYTTKAHNEYLHIAVGSGAISLIVYLLFISIIVIKLMKKYKGNMMCQAIGLSVVAYLIQAFFNISIISTATVFWGLLGIAYSLGNNNGNIKEERSC